MGAAKKVAANSRWTLGLFTHGAGDPNSHNVWAGVASMCAERDVNLICFPGKPLRSPLAFEAQSNILYDLVSERGIDGLVIWASGLPLFVEPQAVSAFCERYRPLPMVTVGIPVEGLPGARVDNYGGMRAVVEHLMDVHGRKRIAFVRGPEGHQEAAERYQAFGDVLSAHGQSLLPELVFAGNFKESGGRLAIEKLIDEDRLVFDALVAASDNMAIGAIRALQSRGLRIPEDIAVAGLNDEKQSAVISPPLTTCPLHFYEQARTATEMVLALLEDQPIEPQVVLPTRLLVRQSCGCADPLVVEAALDKRDRLARPSTRTPQPVDQASLLEAVLTQVASAVDNPVDSSAVAELVAAFLHEVEEPEAKETIATLTEILRRSYASRETVERWHSVFSALRRLLLSHGLNAERAQRAEDLFQQCRVLLGQMGQRSQAYQVLQAEEQSRHLANISERLSTTVEVHELLDILAETLPDLGVPGCYLALYEDPQRPADTARIVMAYGPQGRLLIEPGGRPFPAQELVPPDLLPADRRYSLAVQPLYFQQDQIGFAVVEASPHQEEMCELLRGEISGALKRLQLLARNVDLYNRAVRARVFAEEGRRLAEEANLLKSRFLATVSHELRTPLSLIVGAAEMMLREQADGRALSTQLRLDAESIQTSAEHLASLIGDVLDLASSQAGELRLATERLLVTELLSSAAVLGERLAREKGLLWRSELPHVLPVIMGDRTRLQQVILNLLSNAVKFTGRGAITLWAEAGRDEVVIAISDTGMGTPIAEQEVIFDEFRRSERAARRGYGGIGLGLAISRRLVELHGGKMGVISSGTDGAGSTFYFTLPILEWPDEADARPDSRLDIVLLLTEQVERAGVLVTHLQSRGFQVQTLLVGEGRDWLDQIITAPPGAVILDYEPAADAGWQIMQALKTNAGTRDIPVLFYSLFEDQGGGAFLALDYLAKPIASGALAHALARHGIDRDSDRPRSILIADDEPGMVELHARVVEANVPSCRILTAYDGIEALALMQQSPPDLVLLDLMMPAMDGFTVLQKMRETECTRGIPVIVLTAQILTQEDIARLQSGVAAVLTKGLFTAGEVLTQIEQALTRSKQLGSEGQRLARSLMAYLHEHYAEQIDREELARHFAVNERYLTRCFHQEMGIPPIPYLNRYRVRRACSLLEQGGTTVTDVALATGFSDSAYFARVFQREMGVTPSAYRRGQRAAA